MNQESKNLLFQDLCARLPYGVKCEVYDRIGVLDEISSYGASVDYNNGEDTTCRIEYVKPYLFPLSSMTEEQCEKFKIISGWDGEWEDIKRGKFSCIGYIGLDYIYDTIDWFNKNHFDYRNLIEKDLAIDCTKLNIY